MGRRAASGGVPSLVRLATVTAAVVVAQQIAGKATRDALFLLAHDVGDLPRMMMMSAIACLAAVPLLTRYMVVLGPRTIVPALFSLSALGFVLEYWLSGMAPKTAASLLFVHQSVLGPILISGFWSMASERFDLRTMKANAARIATGATAGGLAGGILVARLSTTVEPLVMLPVLAGLHMLCLVMVVPLRTQRRQRPMADELNTTEVLRDNPYLLHIGLLLLFVTIGVGLLDFTFKEAASQRFEGSDLLRFFAIFYTASSALTLVVQAAVSRWWPRSFGPAISVSSMPAILAVGATTVLLFPSVVAKTLSTALARVVQSSVFRTGYETLYIPVPVAQRRAAKTANDVWFDRLGDLAAGMLITAGRSAGVAAVVPLLMVGVFSAAGAAMWFVRRIGREYIASLEDRVVDGAMDAEGEVRSVLSDQPMQTLFAGVGLEFGPGVGPEVPTMVDMTDMAPSADEPAQIQDAVVSRIVILRSGSPEAIRALLASGIGPDDTAHAIRLLARNELHKEVIAALQTQVDVLGGQMLDALLDETKWSQPVRRRLPRILAEASSAHLLWGLAGALNDTSFQVRYQAGHAMARIHQAHPELPVPEPSICDAITAELQHPLDGERRDGDQRRLEHVFSLLGLFLPTDAMRSAYLALSSDDLGRRGTALEYLGQVLHPPLRGVVLKALASLEG